MKTDQSRDMPSLFAALALIAVNAAGLVAVGAQRDDARDALFLAERRADDAELDLSTCASALMRPIVEAGQCFDVDLEKRLIASIRPAAQGAADTFAAIGWACTVEDRCSVLVEWPAYVPVGDGGTIMLAGDVMLDLHE